MIELGALRIDLDRHAVTRAGQALDVTPTEFDLLKVLMEYPGHAFTRAELIEKGLGYTYDGMDRGIDSHIKNLRKKIEPDPINPTYIRASNQTEQYCSIETDTTMEMIIDFPGGARTVRATEPA